MRVTANSNLVKALEAVPDLEEGFAVSRLASAIGMPASKGYHVMKRLQDVRIVEALPRVERPPDWGSYTLSMRKKFYEEHGLGHKGRDPQLYMYSPLKALALLRRRVQEEIEGIDKRAADDVNALLRDYEDVEKYLTRQAGEDHSMEPSGRQPR